MRCDRCGGALAGEADRCWCSHWRLVERAVTDAAGEVVEAARREQLGEALAIPESLARGDRAALAYLLATADLASVAVVLGGIVLDLLGDLAAWCRADADEMLSQLREGRAR